MDNLPTIKNVISEVLTLLFSSEKKEAIDKALKLLLDEPRNTYSTKRYRWIFKYHGRDR